MAFCPSCEAEYKEGFTVCPDCDLKLVAGLNSENRLHDRGEGKPIALRSFKNSAEAEMVREMLEANGIRAFVEGGEFAIIPSSFSQEVVVMVDERDLPGAVEIYNAYFDSDNTAPASESQTDNE